MNVITEPCDDEGVVLRAYPSRDADLVLHVFFRSFGKLSVLARQARRSQKRFSSSFDLFDRGRFSLAPGRGSLPLVKSFTPQKLLRGLREDLDRLGTSSMLCECFDVLVKEAMENPEPLFTTLMLALEAVDEAKEPREMLRACYFALHDLLVRCGYMKHDADGEPSARRLSRLLDSVEEHSERTLSSRPAVMEIVARLQKERSSDGESEESGRPPARS